MNALRSVHVQMEESVNWVELAYAPQDLLGPTAQKKVFRVVTVRTIIIYALGNLLFA